MLTPLRQQFLIAADAAARLLTDPQLGATWNEPSALPEFRISGLAGHLSLQILYVPQFLAAAEPSGPAIDLDEYYAAAGWIGAAIDDEANVFTRENGERAAGAGAAAVAEQARVAVAELKTSLQTTQDDRLVQVPWAGVLRLDDFLLTRLMELAVHTDDLAVSLGVPTPLLANDTLAPVVELLSRLALRRHGGLALIRALSRAERAPASIAAF